MPSQGIRLSSGRKALVALVAQINQLADNYKQLAGLVASFEGSGAEASKDEDLVSINKYIREHALRRQIYAAGKRGELSLYREGQTYFARRGELDAWLESRRVKPRGAPASPQATPPAPANTNAAPSASTAADRLRARLGLAGGGRGQ